MSLDLTIVILTYNEADHIEACLRSVPDGFRCLVIDSDSSDSTVEMAKGLGAKVINNPFSDYAEQRNFALSCLDTTWVFFLDADERFDQFLAHSIERQVTHGSASAYKVKRRLVFMGSELRYGKTTDHPIRLMRSKSGKFRGAIHEKFVPDQKERIKKLSSGCLIHHSYRNLSDYFRRFNRYSDELARQHLGTGKRYSRLRHYFRPWSEFTLRYFLRLGFLDGYPGYVYALISSTYSFVKYAKVFEMQLEKTRSI